MIEPAIRQSFQRGDGSVWHVVACRRDGQTRFELYTADNPHIYVASYRKRWHADNHAIAGCPCPQGHHYYHGAKHVDPTTLDA